MDINNLMKPAMSVIQSLLPSITNSMKIISAQNQKSYHENILNVFSCGH